MSISILTHLNKYITRVCACRCRQGFYCSRLPSYREFSGKDNKRDWCSWKSVKLLSDVHLTPENLRRSGSLLTFPPGEKSAESPAGKRGNNDQDVRRSFYEPEKHRACLLITSQSFLTLTSKSCFNFRVCHRSVVCQHWRYKEPKVSAPLLFLYCIIQSLLLITHTHPPVCVRTLPKHTHTRPTHT